MDMGINNTGNFESVLIGNIQIIINVTLRINNKRSAVSRAPNDIRVAAQPRDFNLLKKHDSFSSKKTT
jgi:hypothetical protein